MSSDHHYLNIKPIYDIVPIPLSIEGRSHCQEHYEGLRENEAKIPKKNTYLLITNPKKTPKSRYIGAD